MLTMHDCLTTDEIISCPHCARAVTKYEKNDMRFDGRFFRMACACGARGPWADTPDAAQTEWNDRLDIRSLRDWFAGVALQGMLRYDAAFEDEKKAAEWAYSQADAMIAERDKEA